MGKTFTNLHIRIGNRDFTKFTIPSGCQSIQTDSGKLWRKDAASVFEEIEAEKKLNKVDNQTVLTLRQEIPGLLVLPGPAGGKQPSQDIRDNVLRMVHTLEDGSYEFPHICCMQETGEQLLEIGIQ